MAFPLLLDSKAPGKRPILNDVQRRALVEAVECGPLPAIHGVVCWRLIDLVQWLREEFAVSLDETTVSRELKKLGYVKLTARLCHHAQNKLAMEAFKKKKRGFAAAVAEVRATLPQGTPIEVWFQDEARVGQKNTITRRWARRGTRPSAPKEQRTKTAYIFGVICPEEGKGAGLVLPFCNTETVTLHLAEIALGHGHRPQARSAACRLASLPQVPFPRSSRRTCCVSACACPAGEMTTASYDAISSRGGSVPSSHRAGR